MDILHTIILGLIQGLTEFIPVSSSGHLVIGQEIFFGESEHLFLEWINVGTLLALVVYFRKRIINILNEIVHQKDFRLARNILITAIPAGVTGFMLSDFINSATFFGSIITVTVALFVVGVLMIILDKLPHRSGVNQLRDLSPLRALTIGLAQVFALIPGVSRSGSTIIAGRFMGLSPNMAAEYSFLASLPIMIGVTVKLCISSSDRQYLLDNALPLVIGNGVAFIAGMAAIGFLMRYLSRHGLSLFGWYRIVLAAVIGCLLLIQSIK
ncbi:undecaprenyl-diphosphate phosphatase [bacterium]|nr:MAG: undecaprenyl-diphosphate phosphatase [bacterium]